MKDKAKDLQAYWVILTEIVQVTYLKIIIKKKKETKQTYVWRAVEILW